MPDALVLDSHVDAVHRAPADYPSGKKGDVLTIEFTLAGRAAEGEPVSRRASSD
jgi:predicted 3-demethylubiquinone-9 3-methyltransferase (glyoxalase superfamily)